MQLHGTGGKGDAVQVVEFGLKFEQTLTAGFQRADPSPDIVTPPIIFPLCHPVQPGKQEAREGQHHDG